MLPASSSKNLFEGKRLSDFIKIESENLSSNSEGSDEVKQDSLIDSKIQKGTDVDKEKAKSKANYFDNTPFIPDEVYILLPDILKDSCSKFKSKRERDVFLTGAITILSGLLPNLSGTYDRKTVYANLFYFCIAPPASGKGSLSFVKNLGMLKHHRFLKESKEQKAKYKTLLDELKKKEKENDLTALTESAPVKPKSKILYIPG